MKKSLTFDHDAKKTSEHCVLHKRKRTRQNNTNIKRLTLKEANAIFDRFHPPNGQKHEQEEDEDDEDDLDDTIPV